MGEKEKKQVQDKAREETGEVMPEPKTKKIFKRGNAPQQSFSKGKGNERGRPQRGDKREPQGGIRPKGNRQPGSKERWSKQEGRGQQGGRGRPEGRGRGR